MSDYLADLRARAEAAWNDPTACEWYSEDVVQDALIGLSLPSVRAVDARHIVTFDPPTVMALLDVAQALYDLVGEHDGHDTECLRCVGAAALARLRTLTGEDQT